MEGLVIHSAISQPIQRKQPIISDDQPSIPSITVDHLDVPEHVNHRELRGSSPGTSPKQTWWQAAMSLKHLGRKRSGVSESQGLGDGSDNNIQWYLSQFRGPAEGVATTNSDLISCLDFNETGHFLATGDRGGRVVVFQQDSVSSSHSSVNCGSPNNNDSGGSHDKLNNARYDVYCTFQSHEPEFDFRKSIEIDERINQLCWLRRCNPAHFLLTTNEKTVKLWKLSERQHRPEGYNLRDDDGILRIDNAPPNPVKVPVLRPVDHLTVAAIPRRVFCSSHAYHINSISANSDLETFISADDLRINLWHLEVSDETFTIVDLKPENIEDLTEVITTAAFHPRECNILAYGSSKGCIRLCDMRSKALCDQHVKLFEDPESEESQSYFSEIISSISDLKFSQSGRYILTRDYMTLKVWDLQMDCRPIEVIPVHEHVRSKLNTMYESECIFDKFQCAWSSNDRFVTTGSYNHFIKVFDRDAKQEVVLEAERSRAGSRAHLKPRKISTTDRHKRNEVGFKDMNFKKKLLHFAWHPSDHIIAASAAILVYLHWQAITMAH